MEFCSGGPKNYGYVTSLENVVCKVRGFSLDVEGSAQLNYPVLRSNVIAEVEDPREESRITRITESAKIVRHTNVLNSQPRHKDYRLVFNKRVLLPPDSHSNPYVSYLYGYHQV